MSFTEQLRERAVALGFDGVGFCSAEETRYWDEFLRWLEQGYAGTMQYLPRRCDAYRHPDGVLRGCRSLVMLTLAYHSGPAAPVRPGQGRVARYAQGSRDYHDIIRAKLKQLAEWVRQRQPEARVRGVVDTAPLLEREHAERAGLGWIGKHTLLLSRERGSWFFLAAMLTDLILPETSGEASRHCGTCVACLEACPTDAFVAPYELDARRCISYLTIEHRGPIASGLREGLGDWVFGCDVCQEVCPWNRRAPKAEHPDLLPRADLAPLDLIELLELDEAGFARRFGGTPLERPGRSGMLRNAAIVLGNQRATESLSALKKVLHDDDPVLRGAAAWALGRLATPEARSALESRREVETDPEVQCEIKEALNHPARL